MVRLPVLRRVGLMPPLQRVARPPYFLELFEWLSPSVTLWLKP